MEDRFDSITEKAKPSKGFSEGSSPLTGWCSKNSKRVWMGNRTNTRSPHFWWTVFMTEKTMMKLYYILALCLCIAGCDTPKKENVAVEEETDTVDYTKLPSHTADGRQINNTNDDIHAEDGFEILHPGDTANWPIPGYPETITVAFTRNGVFEDSIKCEMTGGDENHRFLYIYRTAVGDAWFYDRDGKFVRFVCVSEPHSGQPHKYKP